MAAMYKPSEAIALFRPSFVLPRIKPSTRRTPIGRFSTTRHAQALSSPPNAPIPPPQRKSITLTGDTGQVRWSDLSPGEKVVRTTQQSLNLTVVIVGVVATAGVGILLFTDVFSPSSKTAYFNRAVSFIRADPRCTKLLGTGSQISAHGEHSWSRHARNRFINDTTWTDKYGTEHMTFRFYVEGPLGQGLVHVHLVKRPSQGEYEYQELAVDVKGQKRVDLAGVEKKSGSVAPKIFGARWW